MSYLTDTFSGLYGRTVLNPCVNGRKNVFVSAADFQQINKKYAVKSIMIMLLVIPIKVFMISKSQ